jgi:hypothetical protein
MNTRRDDEDPDDKFFAPVLRDPPPRDPDASRPAGTDEPPPRDPDASRLAGSGESAPRDPGAFRRTGPDEPSRRDPDASRRTGSDEPPSRDSAASRPTGPGESASRDPGASRLTGLGEPLPSDPRKRPPSDLGERSPSGPGEAGVVSDTGVPEVRGAGHGQWAESPQPSNKLSLRLLTSALVLLAGVVLAVLAVLADHPLWAVPPAVVALAAAIYLVAFGIRRSHSDGGPPTFG